MTFGFEMSVTRVYEPARVTKPYTAAQWSGDRFGWGIASTRSCKSVDVRLTMGGEPTFVAIDDMGRRGMDDRRGRTDEARVRRRADSAASRDRFAPGGLLHYGQGKWYPGETLPRWAFALYWRGDGLPLWHDAGRIAREDADTNPTIEQAAALARGIAQRIDVDPSFVAPAYEDPVTFVNKEAGLPENVSALDSKLDDPEERMRLARAFRRGLNTPAAFVLPVQRWNATDVRRWRSERWSTRSGRVQLVPGDSPAGFRLPLGSLPWLAPSDRSFIAPPDPFAPLPPAAGSPRARAVVRPGRGGRSGPAATAARRTRDRDRRLGANRAVRRTP